MGLLHALYAYISKYASKEQLAREACELEIDVLKETIGKQDQYAASYGGMNFITFYSNGSVNVEPVILNAKKFKVLEGNLLMFYVGGDRSAGAVLQDMESNIIGDKAQFDNLVKMTELAKQLRVSLLSGSIQDLGYFLDENWQLKKSLSRKISANKVDHYYKIAKENGALGGKLLGAGGCGFLLFYCEKEKQEKLRRGLGDLRELRFKFDNFGTKIIYVGEYR